MDLASEIKVRVVWFLVGLSVGLAYANYLFTR